MSHQPERKEKNCLNCETIVQGRYCHVCGQENTVPHQSFGGLTKHFIYDIFHFDGKFFETLIPLFFKPGVVAREYTSGKRVKFLDPIRMYLFTSAVFFLLFFSLATPKSALDLDNYLTVERRIDLANELRKEAEENPGDTTLPRKIAFLLDTVNHKQITLNDVDDDEEDSFVVFGRRSYSSLSEYDSIQKALPVEDRDNWFKRMTAKKSIELGTKYKGRSGDGLRDLWEGLLHRLPYLLFFSLPFFALILKLLYIRRKNFFYSDHAVFTLYHYIFSFLLLVLIFSFNALKNWLHAGFLDFLIAALIIAWFVHLFQGLRNFYKQGSAKTMGKFLLLNMLGFIIILLLFIVFVFFSVFQM